jgi:hypothetical protein
MECAIEFLSAPGTREEYGLSATELMIIAGGTPVLLGFLVGLEREFMLVASIAGVFAVILSG